MMLLVAQLVKGYLYRFIHIKRIKGQGRIFIDAPVKSVFMSNACININGKLRLGFNSHGRNGRTSLLRLGKNSQLVCTGDTRLFFDSDIQLFDNARLYVGDSFINSGCKIRVNQKMIIGDGCAIGTDFTVMDSNFHKINGKSFSSPVIIEDNVWIGTRVTVLPGVTIGKGAIIGAGSVVTKNIAPNSIAVGNPACVIKENIQWSI